MTRRYSYRDVLASNHPWVAPGNLPALNGNINGGQTAGAARFRGYFRDYLGDANGTNVDYAPSTFASGPATYVWGNAATEVFQREPARLDQRPTLASAGGGSNSQTVSKTTGGVIQSMFFGGRLVTTFGTREDTVYDQRGTEPRRLLADGSDFDDQGLVHAPTRGAMVDHNVIAAAAEAVLLLPFLIARPEPQVTHDHLRGVEGDLIGLNADAVARRRLARDREKRLANLQLRLERDRPRHAKHHRARPLRQHRRPKTPRSGAVQVSRLEHFSPAAAHRGFAKSLHPGKRRRVVRSQIAQRDRPRPPVVAHIAQPSFRQNHALQRALDRLDARPEERIHRRLVRPNPPAETHLQRPRQPHAPARHGVQYLMVVHFEHPAPYCVRRR